MQGERSTRQDARRLGRKGEEKVMGKGWCGTIRTTKDFEKKPKYVRKDR